ncbi:uncharacterized protein AB675_2018 [Cyphellophora attinorum]|uniref:Uncharacterized protein n=1 Tax=Cyphellophora attinorum TaxID=1664694 RepID=A0A0N1P229_9EURO|nr:uncharacterized protein AB675_2018 [Phialophora attinorum]KPI42825.1 hypothetical protein AB675_2018 [Phialophora attinorum]
MAFCFVVGTNASLADFTSQLKGYENVTAQCHNCGNWSAHPISSWEWFTFCWIPVIPLGGKHKDTKEKTPADIAFHKVACSICRFRQDMRQRNDIQQGGAGGPPPQHHQMGPPQGWSQGPPQQQQGYGQGPPPGQGGQPVYK